MVWSVAAEVAAGTWCLGILRRRGLVAGSAATGEELRCYELGKRCESSVEVVGGSKEERHDDGGKMPRAPR
jgi:hypothetical protein